MSRADRTTSPSPADLVAVTQLLDRAVAAGAEPLSDHLLVELHDLARQQHVGHDRSEFVLVRGDAPDLLRAYGQASPAGGSWVLGVVTDPALSNVDAEGLTADVLCALVAAVADAGGRPASWWVREPDAAARRAAATAQLSPARVLLQMRRPLPLDESATIAHRAFRPGRDDDAWLQANNRAFAGHPEQGGWTRDTLALRMAEPWFDAEGLRVLDDDGRIVAFCWTKVHPAQAGDPEMGEIYVIGVDPDAHGHGLGRQLTLAGLDHLAATGVRTAMLYVDEANLAATNLYRRLGFSVHHREHAFTLDHDTFSDAADAHIDTGELT